MFDAVSSGAYGEPRQVGYRAAESAPPAWSGRLYRLLEIARTDLRRFDSPPDCTEKPFEKCNLRPFEK
jgi:hypothetical protein